MDLTTRTRAAPATFELLSFTGAAASVNGPPIDLMTPVKALQFFLELTAIAGVAGDFVLPRVQFRYGTVMPWSDLMTFNVYDAGAPPVLPEFALWNGRRVLYSPARVSSLVLTLALGAQASKAPLVSVSGAQLRGRADITNPSATGLFSGRVLAFYVVSTQWTRGRARPPVRRMTEARSKYGSND